MTIDISNNAARVNYTVASGVTQTSFSVPFEFFNDGDLSVYVDDVLKTITTHYTVSGGDGSTGTITMSVTGAAGGSTVVISRSIAIERTSDFQTGVDINRAALNTQLDTLTAIAADNQDKASRSISAPNSEVNPVLELPDADTRKGKLIGFNETTGNIELSATLADGNTLASISGDIATLADIEDGTDATDAIQTVAGISSNVTTVAGVSANVTTVAGNTTNINTVAGNNANITTVAGISTDVTTVSGISSNVTSVAGNETNINTVAADGTDIGLVADDITNVNTVATNIASVNTNAANITDIQNASANAATATTQAGIATTKASEAATSEANAATSETNAATSETNASTSETNAATSATDAASSATSASGSASAALNFQTQAGIYSSNAASSASSALSSKNSASSFATNSANSATSASNSASTATTKASEAAASETAAEAAKVAAEAALDEFTDIYLGAKASDPTTDNDGNALTAGDQYFNTTINVLKIYNGSAWQAAAIDSSGFVETTGDTMTGNLSFGDNDKAIFGAGSDLQIYHDGTNSRVHDTGTGGLRLMGSEFVALQSNDGENMVVGSSNGAVTLYHDNSAKLATTATGIDVTGTVTADGLTVGDGTTGDHTIDLNGAGSSTSTTRIHFQGGGTGNPSTLLSHSASSKDFTISTGNLDAENTRFEVANNGDISFYEDTGTTPKFFWDASAESLGIGTSSPAKSIEIRGGARIAESTGAVLDITPSTTGTNGVELKSTYYADGYGPITFNTGNTANRMVIDSSGNVGIGTSSPAGWGKSLSLSNTPNDSGITFEGASRKFGIGGGNTDGALRFYDFTSSAERMRIDSSGNVGIGTSSPSSFSGSRLVVRPAVGEAGTNDVQSWEYTSFSAGSEFDLRLQQVVSSGLVKHQFNVRNAGTDYTSNLVLDRGNVGIGTSDANPYSLASTGTTLALDSTSASVGSLVSLETAGVKRGYLFGNSANMVLSAVDAAIPLVFKTNDTERMLIDSSGSVGIGTTSPSSFSSLARNFVVNGATSSGITISESSGSGSSNILFAATSSFANRGNISYDHNGSSMAFGVNASEAMRIDSSGNLLVGRTDTSSVTAGTVIYGGSLKGAITQTFAGRPHYINRLTSDGDIIEFAKDGATVGSIGVSGSDLTTSASGSAGGLTWDWQSSGATRKFIAYQNALRPNTANNGAIDLGSDTGKWRDLYLSGGVYLGGTGAANKLDDYETGTFTPTAFGTTAAGTTTYVSQIGSYTKVGDTVHVDINISWTAMTGTGNLRIGGLPFTSSSATNYFASGAVVPLFGFTWPSGSTQLNPIMSASDTAMSFYGSATDSNSLAAATDNELVALAITITYKV